MIGALGRYRSIPAVTCLSDRQPRQRPRPPGDRRLRPRPTSRVSSEPRLSSSAEDDLRARARAYVGGLSARNPDSDVLFASKAFPCTAVYRVLAQEGLACDVASGGELALAPGRRL